MRDSEQDLLQKMSYLFEGPGRYLIVQHYKWISIHLTSVMNWFIEPEQQIDNLYFQLPQPQLLFVSSNLCKPDVVSSSLEDLAFQQFDFIIDKEESFKDDTHSIDPRSFGDIVGKKKISKPRYQKNICGYIFKKALRAFISDSYRNVAVQTCQKHDASYQEAKNFILSRMEKINGPSHLKLILVPKTKEEVSYKKTITEFLEWYLQERYVRHLICEGKMSNKQSYIVYKNKFFPKELLKLKKLTEKFIETH